MNEHSEKVQVGFWAAVNAPTYEEAYTNTVSLLDAYRAEVRTEALREAAEIANTQGAFLYGDTGAKAAHGAWSARDEIRKAVKGEDE